MSSSDEDVTGPQAITLDPIASLREHPQWFFRTGRFEWETMVGLLVTEILYSGVRGSTEIRQVDAWTTISNESDWLAGDLEAFVKLTPFPAGGVNATRVEALLTAFCDSVLTASQGQRHDIRSLGASALPTTVGADLADARHGRIVAFRVHKAPSTGMVTAREYEDGVRSRLVDLDARIGEFQGA
jgi:hypothetical protein